MSDIVEQMRLTLQKQIEQALLDQDQLIPYTSDGLEQIKALVRQQLSTIIVEEEVEAEVTIDEVKTLARDICGDDTEISASSPRPGDVEIVIQTPITLSQLEDFTKALEDRAPAGVRVGVSPMQIIEEMDVDVGLVDCTDCKGSGWYVGFQERRYCPTCDGAGKVVER